MKIAIFELIFLVTAFVSVTAVTSVTHRGQAIACLNICHQEVTTCINLKDDRCLKSYHTCLSKARDIYRCFNSSKIKQLLAIAECFQKRCEEVEEIVITYQNNPLRTEHRKLPFCRPWLKGKVTSRFLQASEKEYDKCELILCKVINLSQEAKLQKQKSNKRVQGESTCSQNRKKDINTAKGVCRQSKVLQSWMAMFPKEK